MKVFCGSMAIMIGLLFASAASFAAGDKDRGNNGNGNGSGNGNENKSVTGGGNATQSLGNLTRGNQDKNNQGSSDNSGSGKDGSGNNGSGKNNSDKGNQDNSDNGNKGDKGNKNDKSDRSDKSDKLKIDLNGKDGPDFAPLNEKSKNGKENFVEKNGKLGEDGFDKNGVGKVDEKQFSDRKDNKWRYWQRGNAWWYWMPGGYWSYWNDGGWHRYNSDTYSDYSSNGAIGPYYEDQNGFYLLDGNRKVYDPHVHRDPGSSPPTG
jgi:hypothetical protein